jgi:hypothetical protein
MITDAAIVYRELKAVCNDESRKPRERIIACRRLLRSTQMSTRAIRVAKRIAKKFLRAENVSPRDRTSAVRLWELCMNFPTLPDENTEDTTESVTQPQLTPEVADVKPEPRKSRIPEDL